MTRVCLIILAAMLYAATTSRTMAKDVFTQGIAAGQAGQFAESAMTFEKLTQAQPAAGTLVNLGIAEWQRGHAGTAIRAWEQALWIDPFDARAGANLKFARPVAQVDAPQLKWFEVASTWLPPNAWVWLAGGSLWLAVGTMTLPRFFRWRKAGWQQSLAALGFGVFLATMTANIGVVSRTNIGFVLKKNVPLRLTPTRDGEVISNLAAGEPARRLRTRGNYNFVQTSSGKGWVERKNFGLISE